MQKTTMKKALIIAYYWPPCGGAAVQRWLKFCKYLPQFGWEPIVYTAKDGEFPQHDPSTLDEVSPELTVLKTSVPEPHKLYKKFTGREKKETLEPELVTSSKKNSLLENFAIWVRGNFFIPDARMFWIKPSVKYLKQYLQENPVDVIISTSPPQSMHLIAMELSKFFNIPWLADFRDPWTRVDYFDQLKLGKSAEAKHKDLEKSVLQNASKVLTVSPTWGNDFKELGAKNVQVITNGYDHQDLPKKSIQLDEKFSIAHIGNISKERVHESLFKTLKKLCDESSDISSNLEIKLIGRIDPAFQTFLKKYDLNQYVVSEKAVSHKKAVEETFKSQVLLLLLGAENKSQGRIPLKVFEYIASKRPILGIGPKNGDVSQIIAKSEAGNVYDFKDEQGIYNSLKKSFELYKADSLLSNSKNAEQFSRENLTAKLAKALEAIT